MKFDIVSFLKVVVGDVKGVDPKITLDKVRPLQDLKEGVYACPTPLSEATKQSRDAQVEASTTEGEVEVALDVRALFSPVSQLLYPKSL